jgi:hypothetical protein
MFRGTFSNYDNCRKKEPRSQLLTEERRLKARAEDVGRGRPQSEGHVRSEQVQGNVCEASTSILPGNARVVDLAIAHASRSPRSCPNVPPRRVSRDRSTVIGSETRLPENCRFADRNGERNAKVTAVAFVDRIRIRSGHFADILRTEFGPLPLPLCGLRPLGLLD